MSVALELVSSRHAEELVQVLRKEAARAASADHDDAAKYRQLLVRAMHRAALKVHDLCYHLGYRQHSALYSTLSRFDNYS